MKKKKVACLFVWAIVSTLALCAPAASQTVSASVTGLVFDPNAAVIVEATVVAKNGDTGIETRVQTNDDGIYHFADLGPGNYEFSVSKRGFKVIIKPGVTLHIADTVSMNFTMQVGDVSETVTVEAGAPLLNTESAAVSTVVDRQFVENMPLNGRSFQDLILLTPGVVTNNPQTAAAVGGSGEFSVNGQRTESNYYSVDGLSANIGIFPGLVEQSGTSGSLPAATALGTTQSLVSLDALQEFRVQSSTYSAEYGRSPGGQFSFATRSGTNQWHGTAFDYLRNNVFDANNWFNNFFAKPEPPLRQNDFGGTLGGPVSIPGLYYGNDRTFFFFSYEGLRLRQPQEASLTYVPDAQLRQNTPVPLQQALNAYPVANGPDLGNGLGEFIGTWSNPSSLDSSSIRVDHILTSRVRLFFRFSHAPSEVKQRSVSNASDVRSSSFGTQTYSIGLSSSLSTSLSNEFRLNYSRFSAAFSFALDNFGGAQAIDLANLQSIDVKAAPNYNVNVALILGGHSTSLLQGLQSGLQRQWNFVDTVGFQWGRHQLKMGVDYRRLEPVERNASPQLFEGFFSVNSVLNNRMNFGLARSFGGAYPLYPNFSAYGQDQWKVTPRLSVAMGLRWEINPAPGAANGNLPYTVEGNSVSTLTLAPYGTPLWRTAWFNFAPRLGVAYALRNAGNYETVVRGGVGVFFDTGQQLGSEGYAGPGFVAVSSFSNVGFPAPSALIPTLQNPPQLPYSGAVYAYPQHLQLPYTLQWNAAVQQSLGKSQSVSVSYVGANGRRLLELNEVDVSAVNPNFPIVEFVQNALTSNYDALQVQFQRRLSQGLQVLSAYTWSHAIDYGSLNTEFPYARGNSSFDIRHNFSAAVSYELPNPFQDRVARALLHSWALDSRLMARTAFPVTLYGDTLSDPATGKAFYAGLSLVPNQSIYLYGATYPGGKTVNPNAFINPTNGLPGDAPRNFVRGFGAWEIDFALRKEFSIHERLKLQFRAEAFNLLNHPNFGQIDSILGDPTFGQATGTLAQSLGGLSPLYQMGGPRSLQLALKVMF